MTANEVPHLWVQNTFVRFVVSNLLPKEAAMMKVSRSFCRAPSRNCPARPNAECSFWHTDFPLHVRRGEWEASAWLLAVLSRRMDETRRQRLNEEQIAPEWRRSLIELRSSS